MQQVQFNPLIALRRRESAPLYSVLCTWRSLVAGVILLVDLDTNEALTRQTIKPSRQVSLLN